MNLKINVEMSYWHFTFITKRPSSNARKNIFENFSVRNIFADILLTYISAKIGHR